MPMAPSTRETTEGTDRVMNPSRVSKRDAEFQAGQPLKAARIESAGPAAYRAMREWSGGVPLGGWPKENLRPPPVEHDSQDTKNYQYQTTTTQWQILEDPDLHPDLHPQDVPQNPMWRDAELGFETLMRTRMFTGMAITRTESNHYYDDRSTQLYPSNTGSGRLDATMCTLQ